MRYKCLNNPNFCHNFKVYHFDRLVLIFDIYVMLYRHIYLKNKNNFNDVNQFFDIFKILNNCVKNALNLNHKEFEAFKLTIYRSLLIKKNKEHKLGFHINSLIYYFCKRLPKL